MHQAGARCFPTLPRGLGPAWLHERPSRQRKEERGESCSHRRGEEHRFACAAAKPTIAIRLQAQPFAGRVVCADGSESLNGTGPSGCYVMKSLLFLRAGAVALLCLAGCQGNRVERASATPLSIRVVGAAGASFTGTGTKDGQTWELSGTVPMELQFASRRLSCRFQQNTGPGSIRFEVYERARLIGGAATTGPGGHCHFSVRNGLMGARTAWRVAKD